MPLFHSGMLALLLHRHLNSGVYSASAREGLHHVLADPFEAASFPVWGSGSGGLEQTPERIIRSSRPAKKSREAPSRGAPHASSSLVCCSSCLQLWQPRMRPTSPSAPEKLICILVLLPGNSPHLVRARYPISQTLLMQI